MHCMLFMNELLVFSILTLRFCYGYLLWSKAVLYCMGDHSLALLSVSCPCRMVHAGSGEVRMLVALLVTSEQKSLQPWQAIPSSGVEWGSERRRPTAAFAWIVYSTAPQFTLTWIVSTLPSSIYSSSPASTLTWIHKYTKIEIHKYLDRPLQSLNLHYLSSFKSYLGPTFPGSSTLPSICSNSHVQVLL